MSRLLIPLALLLAACPSETEECPDGSPKQEVPAVADQCGDIFECDPQIELAFAIGPTDFALIQPGSEQRVFWGTSQGGYHLWVAAEMHGLCPVVFLDFSLDIVEEDGSRTTIQALDRHVQTVRCDQQPDLFPDGCDGDPTQQRWWPLQMTLPCEYYPDDPIERETSCPPEPPIAFIDHVDAFLRVGVRDHSSLADPDQPRESEDEVAIDPVCCS